MVEGSIAASNRYGHHVMPVKWSLQEMESSSSMQRRNVTLGDD